MATQAGRRTGSGSSAWRERLVTGARRRGYSYSSALARTPVSHNPPAMSTFPLSSNVAVWPPLPAVILSVAVNFPLAGLYNSALEAKSPLPSMFPPATSTSPLGNNVAV